MQNLFIIVGCNGAGKITVAYNLLPEVFKTPGFFSADEMPGGFAAKFTNKYILAT